MLQITLNCTLNRLVQEISIFLIINHGKSTSCKLHFNKIKNIKSQTLIKIIIEQTELLCLISDEKLRSKLISYKAIRVTIKKILLLL